MPYIPRKRRKVFDPFLEKIAKEIENQGELNYCIYKLSCLLIEKIGESYQHLSLCSSAMEHAKMEWYRRRLAQYKDKKIKAGESILFERSSCLSIPDFNTVFHILFNNFFKVCKFSFKNGS